MKIRNILHLKTITLATALTMSASIIAGGVPSPSPVVKKVVELDTLNMTVSPDFSIDGLRGAQNADITAINPHLQDNIQENEDRLIRAFHTRHSGGPATPVFSIVALDHPFFSVISILLKNFDYKRFSNEVMNQMFSLQLPLISNLEFFDRRLKSALANISIPRGDSDLQERILGDIISNKGKVKLLLRNRLVFATSSRTKCLVSVKSHFNVIDRTGKVVEGHAQNTFDFGVNIKRSPAIQKTCANLGLTD